MADAIPASSPAPPSRPMLSFQQFEVRIKELTGSQEELLDRIQKLKQEVQKWRLNLDSEVKACKDELLELKKGLNSDVEQLKSEFKEMRSTIQMEQGSLTTRFGNSEINDGIKQTGESRYQQLKDDADQEEEPASIN